MNIPPKRLVFCLACGKCLGKDKPEYGKDHTREFPTHENYLVMPMIDPLLLDDPDSWFKRMKLNQKQLLFY